MCYLCNYASECVQFPLRGGGGGIYVVVLGACGIYICVCVRACMRACVCANMLAPLQCTCYIIIVICILN